MRTITKTVDLYTVFELKELFPKGFDFAYDEYRDFESREFDWDPVKESICEDLARIGLPVEIMYFELWDRIVGIKLSKVDFSPIACEVSPELDQIRTAIASFHTTYPEVVIKDILPYKYSFYPEEDSVYSRAQSNIIVMVEKYIHDLLQSHWDSVMSEETFLETSKANSWEFESNGVICGV